MNIQKSKRSSFFWTLSLITYFYLLICCGFSIADMRESKIGLGDFNASVVLFLVVIAGIVSVLLFFVNQKFAANEDRMPKVREQEEKKLSDTLIPIAVYVLVLLSRGIYIGVILNGKLSGASWILDYVAGGRIDLIPGEEGFGFFGADWLYAVFLKPFCMLLGYRAAAVYALNTVCQVVAVCCLYGILKMIVGRAGGIAFGTFFLCMPFFYESVSACEPVHILMALGTLVLLLYVRNLKRAALQTGGGKGRKAALGYAAAGILAGLLLIADLSLILIPLSAAVFYFVSVRRKTSGILLYLLGLLAGAGALLALFGYLSGGAEMLADKAVEYLQGSITLYEESFFSRDAYLLFPHNPELIVLILFCASALFMFFKSGHDPLRMTAVPFFLILFACAANLFQSGTFMIFYTLVCVMSCVAYGMLFLPAIPVDEIKQEPEMENKQEEKENGAEAEPAAKENRGTYDLSETKAAKETEGEQQGASPLEKDVEEHGIKTAETSKVRLIENPLPVPARHEHKKMDFAHEIPPERMHYDVDNPQDDDYDRVRS